MVMACLRWLPTSRPSTSAVAAQLSISFAEVPLDISESSNKRAAAVANFEDLSLDSSQPNPVAMSQAERALMAEPGTSPAAGESLAPPQHLADLEHAKLPYVNCPPMFAPRFVQRSPHDGSASCSVGTASCSDGSPSQTRIIMRV
jgi:hypothetical protein